MAHDAPKGWSYPSACCSGVDCRQISDKQIHETVTGYKVPSGEIVPYSDKRIKDSPDGEYHWCTVQGKDTGHTICLFTPPKSY